MDLRVFYVLSNNIITNDDIKNTNIKFAINENKEEIKLFFNENMENVLNDEQIKTSSKQNFMYGFALDYSKDMLKNIKELFNLIAELLDDVIIIFDTGAKRYINKYEFSYYQKNLMPIDKLFNIDITSSTYKAEYKTVGLKSILIDEIKMYDKDQYNYDVYLKFKNYIINSIANNNFELLMIKEECDVVDGQEVLEYNIIHNSGLSLIYNKHLVDSYEHFVNLFNVLKNDSNYDFYLNGIKVDVKDTLPLPNTITYLNYKDYFTSYYIKAPTITYNHINIFYALKYL